LVTTITDTSSERSAVRRACRKPLNPTTGDIVATVELEETAPEGAAADGKGHIFVNNESKTPFR